MQTRGGATARVSQVAAASMEDLAGCATDDLYGWIEDKSGSVLITLVSLNVSASRVANVMR